MQLSRTREWLRRVPLAARRTGVARTLAQTALRLAFGSRATDPANGDFLPYHGTGKRRLSLLLDTTNKCNLRCVMCHFASPETQRTQAVQLSLDDLDALERDVLPYVRHASLSYGTEPLMGKHFHALLDVVQRAGVPEFEMITNATLMTPEHARRIVASGMTRVQLSVDAATRETYESIRVRGRFDDFLRGVALLNEAKGAADSETPTLQFNVTLLVRNLDELEDVLRLAAASGASRLDLRHMVILDGLGMEGESLRTQRARANRALEAARALAAELGLEIVRFPEPFDEAVPDAPVPTAPETPEKTEACSPVPAPLAIAEAPVVPAEREPTRPEPELPLAYPLPDRPLCSAPWEQISLRPDGEVVPCCFWYGDTGMGNLHERGFRAIWNGPRYRRLRTEILAGQLTGSCLHCPMIGIGDPQANEAFEAGPGLD